MEDTNEVDDIIEQFLKDHKKTSLNLAHRHLKVIPAKLSNLIWLKHLLLNDNDLVFPPTEVLPLAQTLTELILDNNRLTLLPARLDTLKCLRILSVSSNNIGILPSEIGKLENLRQLWVNNCGLFSLPGEIAELKQLEKLGLRQNKLQVLPKEIKNLKCLRWLNCCCNELIDIPNTFSLNSLTYLNLNNNKFEFVPKSITGAQSLKVLLLSGNKISSLCDALLVDLAHIVKLDLRDNKMQILPDHWKGMSHIYVGPKLEPELEE
ncbi:uncharacterized protein LOC143447523 isoform X2 [Clavelina lepadiformis]|uniref:uncharacterized protein LOC143447523 isoform X2 n=1 Tax=Clavelina lepadiformis TaxID=159417 RepID=UPI0040428FE8